MQHDVRRMQMQAQFHSGLRDAIYDDLSIEERLFLMTTLERAFLQHLAGDLENVLVDGLLRKPQHEVEDAG